LGDRLKSEAAGSTWEDWKDDDRWFLNKYETSTLKRDTIKMKITIERVQYIEKSKCIIFSTWLGQNHL
jgi:hypothetical protein